MKKIKSKNMNNKNNKNWNWDEKYLISLVSPFSSEIYKWYSNDFKIPAKLNSAILQ